MKDSNAWEIIDWLKRIYEELINIQIIITPKRPIQYRLDECNRKWHKEVEALAGRGEKVDVELTTQVTEFSKALKKG